MSNFTCSVLNAIAAYNSEMEETGVIVKNVLLDVYGIYVDEVLFDLDGNGSVTVGDVEQSLKTTHLKFDDGSYGLSVSQKNVSNPVISKQVIVGVAVDNLDYVIVNRLVAAHATKVAAIKEKYEAV